MIAPTQKREQEVGLRGTAKENGKQQAKSFDHSLVDLEVFSQKHTVAVIAVRIHLFPFRTEKLSSPSPMVLPYQVGE